MDVGFWTRLGWCGGGQPWLRSKFSSPSAYSWKLSFMPMEATGREMPAAQIAEGICGNITRDSVDFDWLSQLPVASGKRTIAAQSRGVYRATFRKQGGRLRRSRHRTLGADRRCARMAIQLH